MKMKETVRVSMMRDLSIYIHIPFCVRKCRYCDFLSYPAPLKEQEEYLQLLLLEIEKQSLLYKDHRVISVFIGGGTPSLLDQMAVEKIINKLNQDFIFSESPEITIEANPGTVTKEKLAAWKKAGINRLSIGAQSCDDSELRTLGRIHDHRTFCTMYEAARESGFVNINIDLMAAIPGQTYDSYRQTLEKVLKLAPEHISAYSLILEEGTWFYEHQNELVFLTEEEDRRLYELTGEMLAAYGYRRYEISNYAREGYECLHNKVYWQRGDYVGFGLGAASMVEEVRWNNACSFNEYRDMLQRYESAGAAAVPARTAFGENITYLSPEEQMEEFMFLGLRLMQGVSRNKFAKKFKRPMQDVYGEVIENLKADGLLVENGDHIRLTPYGIDISNYVMAKFLL
ncbi:MAG: radical SAM family heme chaperone HemW [Roseburia sp.]|nr:radical SAM family heme chaperone HemW [Roseburia sp.]MCM1243650.1 radical SAM family heme chaperone HemW [Roseburia sp.]